MSVLSSIIRSTIQNIISTANLRRNISGYILCMYRSIKHHPSFEIKTEIDLLNFSAKLVTNFESLENIPQFFDFELVISQP